MPDKSARRSKPTGWSKLRRRNATPGTAGGQCPQQLQDILTDGSTAVLAFVPDLDEAARTEIRGFEKLSGKFADLGTELVVVTGSGNAADSESSDAVKVVADNDGSFSDAMQVLGDDGRPVRATFLVDQDACVAYTFYRVNPMNHAATVLRTLKRLRARRPSLRSAS